MRHILKIIYNAIGSLLDKQPAAGITEPVVSFHPLVSGVERPSPGYWIKGLKMVNGVVTFSGRRLEMRTIAPTKSMDGNFDAGHVLIIEREIKPGEVTTGDFIVYQAPGKEICHQVWNITEDGGRRIYTTWGTNNHIPDPYRIKDENIVGVVVAVIYTKI